MRKTIRLFVNVPIFGRVVTAYYERRSGVPGWDREHPYDRLHRVRTSGMLAGAVLGHTSNGYGAAQPSIIRAALSKIPNPHECHFRDYGCGKGRPLLVATEFGFRTIVGLELSPTLARTARQNARIFARSHPNVTPIDVITGDAFEHPLPEEKLVIFFYNPFGHDLTARFVSKLEASLEATPRDLYVVYMNPAWADLMDASPALERRYAAQIPYAGTEIGFGPDVSDAVVIWQNKGNQTPLPPSDRHAAVRIVTPGFRAELVS